MQIVLRDDTYGASSEWKAPVSTMCKNHPTCNAALVRKPCSVNGLHMKFGQTGRQLQVDHHWSVITCMTWLHGEKTWNWWKIIILWLSREKGHITSAISRRSGCNWQLRSCFNMSLFKPKNLFYIHILLERLWSSKTRRTVTCWYVSIGNLHWKKKPRHKRCSIPLCCTTVATSENRSFFALCSVLAGPNATWITEPRKEKCPQKLYSFHFAALRYLWKGMWC